MSLIALDGWNLTWTTVSWFMFLICFMTVSWDKFGRSWGLKHDLDDGSTFLIHFMFVFWGQFWFSWGLKPDLDDSFTFLSHSMAYVGANDAGHLVAQPSLKSTYIKIMLFLQKNQFLDLENIQNPIKIITSRCKICHIPNKTSLMDVKRETENEEEDNYVP